MVGSGLPGRRDEPRVDLLDHLAERVGERDAGVAPLDQAGREGVFAGPLHADQADQGVRDVGHSTTSQLSARSTRPETGSLRYAPPHVARSRAPFRCDVMTAFAVRFRSQGPKRRSLPSA